MGIKETTWKSIGQILVLAFTVLVMATITGYLLGLL